MNVLERQAKLFRDLTELQMTTSRSLSDLDANAVKQYFELNEGFAQRLPSGADFNAWTELSREYGEAIWSNYSELMKARGEIVREAMDKSNEVYRSVFEGEEEVAPPTPVVAPVAAA